MTSSATPTCPGDALDYCFNIYVRLTSSSLSIDHIYVGFCAYVRPRVFLRRYIIPTPVSFCYPVRTGTIAHFMWRILLRPHLLPRVAVNRCAPMVLHETACTALTTWQTIIVISLFVYSFQDKYFASSVSSCSFDLLLLLIKYLNWGIHSNLINFSLLSGATKLYLWPIRHWGGESLLIPSIHTRSPLGTKIIIINPLTVIINDYDHYGQAHPTYMIWSIPW